MAVKHTKPQTAVDDDQDACTSTSPTPPGLAAQRSYADAWCTPSARPRQTCRSMRTTAPVPGSRSSCTTRSFTVGRIPAHRFVVPKRHRLHHPSDDPPQQQPWRNSVTQRQLQTRRAVRHRLRCIHLAPQLLAIRLQPRHSFLYFFHPSRFKEIFHAETPPQSTFNNQVQLSMLYAGHYPPAMAPMISRGSAPEATASGNGVSGGSRE